jgi:exopolysaccharide biosynthesis predicted pyruvyltransferase EpsI
MKCKKEVLRKIAKSRNRTRILTWRNFYKISKDLKKKQEIFQTPPNLSVSTKNQKTSKVQSLPNLSPNEVQNNSIT